MRLQSPYHRRLIRGTIFVLLIIGGSALAYGVGTYPPNEQSFYPRCQLHSLTGLHCPGCGLTRSVHSLLNGQIGQAIAWNPLALVIVPLVGYLALRWLWYWAWEKPLPNSRRYPTWFITVIGTILVLFGILRNVPIEPFSRLAPHEIVNAGE